jgi:hypothetical protein
MEIAIMFLQMANQEPNAASIELTDQKILLLVMLILHGCQW